MSQSGTAKDLILGRIAGVLGRRSDDAAAAYQGIRRAYLQSSPLTHGELVSLMADRLQHYQVTVYRCGRVALPATIADALRSRGKSRMVMPRDLPAAWLPPDVQFIPDMDLGYAALDRAEGVLTGCSLAIASTGTLVLRHAAGEGRRALTLIPDYHLCVMMEDQIVQSVPEAMRRLAGWNPALVTTISGPSATADIEMTRIRGVHGPRTLDVVIVE